VTIKKKLILIMAISITGFLIYGIYVLVQLDSLKNKIVTQLPAAITALEDTSRLDSKAQQIRYLDEVLTQSARNYALTGDDQWQNRYLEYAPKLEKTITEAIEVGNDQDKKIFTNVDQADKALIALEAESMRLATDGNKEGAIAILDGDDYAGYKATYQQSLEEYIKQRGVKYNEALVVSTNIANIELVNYEKDLTRTYYLVLILLTTGILFVLWAGIYAYRLIVKPLNDFAATAEKISAGDNDARIEYRSKDEIGKLAENFNAMVDRVIAGKAEADSKVIAQTEVLKKKDEDLSEQQKAIMNVLEDVQEEKQKTEAIADDLMKFQLAVSGASDHIVITDPDGIIIFANPAVTRITGYPVDEVIGKKAGSKVLWGGRMPLKTYQALWKTIKEEKKPFAGVLNNQRKNGEKYLAMANISPVLDDQGKLLYFIGIERDITLEVKSREESQELAAIIENTQEAVYGEDLKGLVTNWNHGAERLYGFKASEIIGKSVQVLVPKEKQEEFKKIIAEAAQGKATVNLQTKRLRKDGSEVDVSLTASPIKEQDGKVIGASVIAHDITKEKQIDQAKTEFVSLASHQLRTPLSAINWYAEMLLAGDAGKLTKNQKEYLDQVYQSNQRMVDLVNSLLNVSRIELGTFAVEPEDLDIKAVAHDVIVELTPMITQKKQKLTENYGPKIPTIKADPKLTRIIFQNLLSNAVKYTQDKGTIELSIVKNNPKFLEIKVADNGMGIPLKEQGKIFTKLFRADNVRVTDTEGTGLGMYIVKSIVENVGGTISFVSTEKKGTTFTVLIPITGMKQKKGNKSLD